LLRSLTAAIFGVAAFCYAALHTVFYLISEQTLGRVLEELPRFDIWTGWLAFLIFLPLAATSMNYAVRKLGPRWKALHRWTYAAALLTLFKWASLDGWQGVVPALVNFAPLIALSAYRTWRRPAPPRGGPRRGGAQSRSAIKHFTKSESRDLKSQRAKA
jgi:sulfoxide reductase heme-binding subunit YedZ